MIQLQLVGVCMRAFGKRVVYVNIIDPSRKAQMILLSYFCKLCFMIMLPYYFMCFPMINIFLICTKSIRSYTCQVWS
jgi:hypothetical protein